MSCRTSLMPAGSRPLAGSSRTSSAGSLSRAAADLQPLPHAERVSSSPGSTGPGRASPTRPQPSSDEAHAPDARELGQQQPQVASRPVMVGKRAGVSTHRADAADHRGGGRVKPRWRPSPGTGEAVRATKPSKQRIVVVLPDPLGPRNPNTPPSGTLRSSPATATVRPPRSRRYSLRNPSVSMTGDGTATNRHYDAPAPWPRRAGGVPERAGRRRPTHGRSAFVPGAQNTVA